MIRPSARTSLVTLLIFTSALAPGQVRAQPPIVPPPAPVQGQAQTQSAPGQTAPAGQSGQPPTPSAADEIAGRRHFEKGQELYSKSRFLEAAKEFEAGYRALPRSAFLLNVGHSYRRAYELRKAKAAYETMLRVDPTSPHRPLVEDLIRTIDDALIAQTDTPPATTPTAPGPLTAAPAPVAPRPSLDLTPPPSLTETGPPAESDSIFTSPWFWGVVGVVAVASTVGVVLLLRRSPGCPAQECLAPNR